MQATVRTAEFRATSTPERASFLAMAAAITFTLLMGVGQIADQQVDDALLAQAAATPVASVGVDASSG